jgi:hypothetical protein
MTQHVILKNKRPEALKMRHMYTDFPIPYPISEGITNEKRIKK